MSETTAKTSADTGRTPARHYSVVVVGGGINGIGVFRDLCEQGVACLLVERGDFCSGASAAPSRLIHGGIKYLETGELRLVRQSTLERNRLLICAPHCVKPIETVVPARSWFGGIVPSVRKFAGRKARLTDRGLLILACGVTLFDWFGRRQRTMPTASFRWGVRFRRSFPDMASDITGAATYYDARIAAPERLGLELVIDARAACDRSLALNYASIETVEAGLLHLRDGMTGEVHAVTADLVVNASGAWIDRVNRTLGIRSAYIGGQKGSHLIVENDRLREALGTRMIYFGSADGRISLLYAFLGNILIGSTDIPVDDADDAACDEAEIDYMLAAVAEIFPGIPITRDQVKYRYSGVRPLPRSTSGDPGSVSRDHSIVWDTLPGTRIPVCSLIGGKWTTFRGFAEEATDLILARLDRRRQVDTRALPIGGGRGYPTSADARAAFIAGLAGTIAPPRAADLFERYGTRAREVADWCAVDGDRPLESCPSYSRREIAYLARHEMVVHLGDVLHRRTDIALSGGLTMAAIEEVGDVMARSLGWTRDRLAEEIRHTARRAGEIHGVSSLSSPLATQTAPC